MRVIAPGSHLFYRHVTFYMSIVGDDVVWLFVRGAVSVRLMRHESPTLGVLLAVCGPGNEKAEYVFNTLPDCMTEQLRIEQWLMAEGFEVSRVAERRRRPRASDEIVLRA